MRLFSVLPYKVRGLRIECDQKAKRGKAITGEVVVDTGGATPVRHVIHLQVTRPDGKAVRDLAQNLETANGAARFSIPIALNGPEGEWALRFADVATQVENSVELNVQ